MRHFIGEIVCLGRELPTKCCSHVIPVGCYIEIMKRASNQNGVPRVLWIAQRTGLGSGGWHRVKAKSIFSEDEVTACRNIQP